jgi:Protein of unknown function (DUF742)
MSDFNATDGMPDDLEQIDEDLIDDSFGARGFLGRTTTASAPPPLRLEKQISSRVAAIRAIETGQTPPPLAVVDDDEEDDGGIRSFTITSGRTTARSDVMFETIVGRTNNNAPVASDVARSLLVIVGREPLSVAELAVHLEIPIGISRVLVSDLLDSGHVTSAALSAPVGSAPSKTDLLKRVISRVEAL